MMLRRSLGAPAALLVCLVACSDDKSASCPTPDGGNVGGQDLAIIGRVLDAERGSGIDGAVVTTSDGKSATTKAYGVFQVEVGEADKAADVRREDYAETTRALPKPGGSLDVMLKRIDQRVTFRGDKGITLTLASGEQLKIPANAMTDTDKQAIAGEIELEFTKVDGRTKLQAAALPGDGSARKQDGTRGKVSLELGFSIHAREVASGKQLSVKAEKDVVVEIPVRAGKQQPQSFSFDRKTEQWVEESAVRRSGTGKQAVDVADIDHLSWWAVGAFFDETTCLRLCVEDSEGERVGGAQVWLAGISHAGVSSFFTDASGCGAVDTLPDSDVELIAQFEGRASELAGVSVASVTASAEDDASACQDGGSLVLSALPAASCPLCDGELAPVDGGVLEPDAGNPLDAGSDAEVPELDGGAEPDAQAPELDGGVEPDAGASDAGGELDAAVPLDASTADAGSESDAGVPVGEIAQLAAGDQHACALYTSGAVYCWGANTYGSVGQGSAASSASAGRVIMFTGANLTSVTAISSAAGANHTCALRSDGSVVCWGRNDQGQCGSEAPASEAPRAYVVPDVVDATAISVGLNHSCAVIADGHVVCWGSNASGKLGIGSTTPATSSAALTMVEFNADGPPNEIGDAVAVAAARNHTCVLHAGQTKVSCAGSDTMGGSGWAGALGRATSVAGGQDPVAAPAALPNGTMVQSLHAAGSGFYSGHTCVLPEQGRPICWGANTYSQIASSGGSVASPQQLDAYYSAPQQIALGRDFTCVSYVNAEFGPRVACQGLNGSGQLGNSTTSGGGDAIPDDVGTAQDRSTLLSGASVELMVAGSAFVCVKLTSGGVTCWGSNGGSVFGATGADRGYCDLTALVPLLP